jgi:hypothetical protein
VVFRLLYQQGDEHMLACGVKIPGARISDFGFYLVFLISLLAGAAILMGMKLAFEEDEANKDKTELVITVQDQRA